MLLQQLVERAAPNAGERIVVLKGSEHLISFLGPLSTRVVVRSPVADVDSPTSEPVLRIGAIGTSEIEASVQAAAEGLGESDVLVLAMRSAPDRLPVGLLVDTLVGCGLWVVEAAPAPARGLGCALVVTRDDSAQWRSYLLGDTIPRGERSVMRLRAEGAVEALALRAQGAVLRRRDQERTLELDRLRLAMDERDAELEELRKAMEDRKADRAVARLLELVDFHETELRGVTKELKHAQQAERQGGHVRRAIRIVREHPVHGSSQVLSSAWRRIRAGGHGDPGRADHQPRNGPTSGNDETSV